MKEPQAGKAAERGSAARAGGGRRSRRTAPPGHLRRAEAMAFLPDESRSLPPPPLLNKGTVGLGFAGWLAALVDNAFNQRPIIRAGAGGQGRGVRGEGWGEGLGKGLFGVWGPRGRNEGGKGKQLGMRGWRDMGAAGGRIWGDLEA